MQLYRYPFFRPIHEYFFFRCWNLLSIILLVANWHHHLGDYSFVVCFLITLTKFLIIEWLQLLCNLNFIHGEFPWNSSSDFGESMFGKNLKLLITNDTSTIHCIFEFGAAFWDRLCIFLKSWTNRFWDIWILLSSIMFSDSRISIIHPFMKAFHFRLNSYHL